MCFDCYSFSYVLYRIRKYLTKCFSNASNRKVKVLDSRPVLKQKVPSPPISPIISSESDSDFDIPSSWIII